VNVCGVIIDSAPGKPRYSNAVRAFGTSLHVNPVLRYFMMCGLYLYLVVNGWLAWINGTFSPSYKKKSNHFLFEHMADDPTRWPMLFLYSTSDKIILHADIEEMMMRRRALGVHVSSVNWDDTDHVSHIRKHAEEYEQACEDFLEYCVGGAEASGVDVDVDEEDFQTEEDYLIAKKQ